MVNPTSLTAVQETITVLRMTTTHRVEFSLRKRMKSERRLQRSTRSCTEPCLPRISLLIILVHFACTPRILLFSILLVYAFVVSTANVLVCINSDCSPFIKTEASLFQRLFQVFSSSSREEGLKDCLFAYSAHQVWLVDLGYPRGFELFYYIMASWEYELGSYWPLWTG